MIMGRWFVALAALVALVLAGPVPAQGFATPPPAYTVSLSASDLFPWATRSVTLTATTNRDISGYDLMIYPNVPGARLLTICVQGTTCSVQVSQDQPGPVSYVAVVATTIAPLPPPVVMGRSAPVAVTWYRPPVDLTTNLTAVTGSSPVQITATAAVDVGPTPYDLEIFDATAGTLVTLCGRGSTCTATVARADASTHRYVASIAPWSATFPPSGHIGTSPPAYVTWAAQPVPLTLTNVSPEEEDIARADPAQPVPPGTHTELYWERDNVDGTIASFTLKQTCGYQCRVFVPYADAIRKYSVAFAVPDGGGTTAPPSAAIGQSPVVNFPF
jgi:hypothetical protein